jgi:hypothetical protein
MIKINYKIKKYKMMIKLTIILRVCKIKLFQMIMSNHINKMSKHSIQIKNFNYSMLVVKK